MPVTIDQIRGIIRRKDDVTPEDMLALALLIEGGIPAGVSPHLGKGAYVRGNDITTFNGLFGAINFGENAEDYDDLGFFTGASPAVFTIPTVVPAIERVQVSVMCEWAANATGNRRIQIVGNGAGARDVEGWMEWDQQAQATGQTQASITMAPHEVTSLDTIQIFNQQSSGGNLDIVDIHVGIWVVQ